MGCIVGSTLYPHRALCLYILTIFRGLGLGPGGAVCATTRNNNPSAGPRFVALPAGTDSLRLTTVQFARCNLNTPSRWLIGAKAKRSGSELPGANCTNRTTIPIARGTFLLFLRQFEVTCALPFFPAWIPSSDPRFVTDRFSQFIYFAANAGCM